MCSFFEWKNSIQLNVRFNSIRSFSAIFYIRMEVRSDSIRKIFERMDGQTGLLLSSLKTCTFITSACVFAVSVFCFAMNMESLFDRCGAGR